MKPPAVSIEEISRLCDNQVSANERIDIESRLKSDVLSQALYDRMQTLSSQVTGAILASPSRNPLTVGDAGLDDDTLMRMADNALSAEERKDIEKKVSDNPHLLDQVLSHMRTATVMKTGSWPRLPKKVQEALSQMGLASVQEVMPDENWNQLELMLTPNAVMSRVYEGPKITATIELRTVSSTLAKLTVQLRARTTQHANQTITIVNAETKRKFYSGKTDIRGKLVLPRLHAGQFDLHLKGSPIKVELRLRSPEK